MFYASCEPFSSPEENASISYFHCSIRKSSSELTSHQRSVNLVRTMGIAAKWNINRFAYTLFDLLALLTRRSASFAVYPAGSNHHAAVERHRVYGVEIDKRTRGHRGALPAAIRALNPDSIHLSRWIELIRIQSGFSCNWITCKRDRSGFNPNSGVHVNAA